jgi:hypothetical protein
MRVIFLCLFLTGCTSIANCPKPPTMPDFDMSIDKNLPNGEFVKEIVVKKNECESYYQQCRNYL